MRGQLDRTAGAGVELHANERSGEGGPLGDREVALKTRHRGGHKRAGETFLAPGMATFHASLHEMCVYACVRCMSVPDKVLCDPNAWELLNELGSCISQLLPQ